MTSNEEPLDLAAIRARVDAATEGPWRHENVYGDVGVGLNARIDISPHTTAVAHGGTAANAEFIAHARNDVPALLDALAAAQAEIERLIGNVVWNIERADNWAEATAARDAAIAAALTVDHTEYEPEKVINGMRTALLAHSPADALDSVKTEARNAALADAADELDGVSILWYQRKNIPRVELVEWLRRRTTPTEGAQSE